MNKQDKLTLPYSYHTFLYPFSYQLRENPQNSTSTEELLKEIGWERESFYEKGNEQYPNQFAEQYNVFQYLLPSARKMVFNFGSDSKTCKHYIFSDKQLNTDEKRAQYRIVIRNGENCVIAEEERTIALDIVKIRLSIFQEIEIGVLSIEMEYNHMPPIWNGSKYIEDPFDICCLINDYGRRLFSPIYDTNNSFLPEKNILELATGERVITDFSSKESLHDIKKNITPNLINWLINGTRKTEIAIDSVLDDRMYAAYVIMDDSISNACKEKDILSNEDLYRFVFCDAKEASCQSKNMLIEKLEEHIYPRWMKYGTIHSVTEYSMGCITADNSDLIAPVINPFITEYTLLVKFALAQRAAMVKLENEAGEVSKELMTQDNSGKSNEKLVEKIRDLWKKYVLFQNEIYLPEATFQEQGVEIYDMLKKFLKLGEQNHYLDEELNNLRDVAELTNSEIENENAKRQNDIDNKMNKSINLLTVASVSLAIVSMAQDFLADVSFVEAKTMSEIVTHSLVYFVGFIILSFLVVCATKRFNKSSEENRKSISKAKYLIFCYSILLLVFFMFMAKIFLPI